MPQLGRDKDLSVASRAVQDGQLNTGFGAHTDADRGDVRALEDSVIGDLLSLAPSYIRMVQAEGGKWDHCGLASATVMKVMDRQHPAEGLEFARMKCQVVSLLSDTPELRATFSELNEIANEVRNESLSIDGISKDFVEGVFRKHDLFRNIGTLHDDIVTGKLNRSNAAEWIEDNIQHHADERAVMERLVGKIVGGLELGRLDRAAMGEMNLRWGHTIAIARVPGSNEDIAIDFTTKQFEAEYPLVAERIGLRYDPESRGEERAIIMGGGKIGYLTEDGADFDTAANTVGRRWIVSSVETRAAKLLEIATKGS